LVEFWISEIDHDFDLVLILEELDLSLAVLKIKYCWDLIVSSECLKFNILMKNKKMIIIGIRNIVKKYKFWLIIWGRRGFHFKK